MDRRWYVIANAARARIVERTEPSGPLVSVADLVHASSRLPRAALADDALGHMHAPTRSGPGGTGFAPRTDPLVREHERFAREVAQAIDRGVAERRATSLVLVASNPFLGLLRAQLGPAAAALVVRSVPHDYTTLAEPEILERLQASRSPR